MDKKLKALRDAELSVATWDQWLNTPTGIHHRNRDSQAYRIALEQHMLAVSRRNRAREAVRGF